MPNRTPRIIIREASREDIPKIVWVSATSIGEGEDAGFGGMGSDSPYRDAAKLQAVWKHPNRVDLERVFVAELDGSVVGVVTVEERMSELELVDIDVSREYQRQGVGSSLVAFVEQRAYEEGKDAVTLGTSRNADGIPWKALPWWESQGYRVTHEEENAWTRSIGPGAREIRMRKEL